MPPDDVVEHLAHVLVGVERAEHGVDRVRADLVPALDQLDQLVDHLARLLDVAVVALERELVPAQAHRALEPIAQRLEHAVAAAIPASSAATSFETSRTSCTAAV